MSARGVIIYVTTADLAVAADMLGTTPTAIQDAVLAAWPAAAEWDWA